MQSNRISRIENIDLLRGIVLILMLLDHTRTFFNSMGDPLSLTDPNPEIFFTRWITHFCAPIFIFLAGISAYLYAHRANHGVKKTSYFLLTRGLWFILMEWTVIFFAWTFFNIDYFLNFGIFAAIGFSMIFLSIIIFLPLWMIGLISILLIAGHNLLDPISSSSFESGYWLWMILHEKGKFDIAGILDAVVLYPVIPWMGVIALGYFIGQIFSLPEKPRRAYLWGTGLVFVLLFMIIRYINVYGDPNTWSIQENILLTIMSFLNTNKYPASFLFILMTIGPALIFLGLLPEKWTNNKFNQFIMVYGKVPFFFYVSHLILTLACAFSMVYFTYGAKALEGYIFYNSFNYGYDHIVITYLLSFIFLFALYYPCLWYGQYKDTHKKWYLSYL